jgi:hypothetical protein
MLISGRNRRIEQPFGLMPHRPDDSLGGGMSWALTFRVAVLF